MDVVARDDLRDRALPFAQCVDNAKPDWIGQRGEKGWMRNHVYTLTRMYLLWQVRDGEIGACWPRGNWERLSPYSAASATISAPSIA
jgi:hypothetical protein